MTPNPELPTGPPAARESSQAVAELAVDRRRQAALRLVRDHDADGVAIVDE